MRGLYSSSMVVQTCTLRIWDQMNRNLATEVFAKSVSFIDQMTLERY